MKQAMIQALSDMNDEGIIYDFFNEEEFEEIFNKVYNEVFGIEIDN